MARKRSFSSIWGSNNCYSVVSCLHVYSSFIARNDLKVSLCTVGHTSLTTEYDQGLPAGYLQKTTVPPTSTNNGLSPDLDSHQSHGLHVKSPARIQSATVSRIMTRSRYDDPRQQRGDVNTLIFHHEERQSHRLPSAGLAECKNVLCLYCRPKQTSKLGFPSLCIREACSRKSVCDLGFCTICLQTYNQRRVCSNYYRQPSAKPHGRVILPSLAKCRKCGNAKPIDEQYGLCLCCIPK